MLMRSGLASVDSAAAGRPAVTVLARTINPVLRQTVRKAVDMRIPLWS
jgi:hypothetical protein